MLASRKSLGVASGPRGRHDEVDETEELIRGAAQHPGQGADLRGRRLASPGPPLPPGDRAHVAAERLSQGGPPSGYQYPLPGGGYGIRATYVQALWAMARSAPDALARELEAEALAAAEDADLNV